MFAQQTKNRRKSSKSTSDRYLTRAEQKALEWLEQRRLMDKAKSAAT